MRTLFTFLDDLIYSLSGWIETKTEVFNAFMGATLCCFMVMMLFIILLLPQMILP